MGDTERATLWAPRSTMDILEAAESMLARCIEVGAGMLAVPFVILGAAAFAAFPASGKAKLLFALALLNELRGVAGVAGLVWNYFQPR